MSRLTTKQRKAQRVRNTKYLVARSVECVVMRSAVSYWPPVKALGEFEYRGNILRKRNKQSDGPFVLVPKEAIP